MNIMKLLTIFIKEHIKDFDGFINTEDFRGLLFC